MHVCPQCGGHNKIVNQCRCDPDNLPTAVMSHTPGPLWKAPIQERCLRVAKRVNRGVYTRIMQADYSNLGEVLFDEPRMARDLGLSIEQLRDVLDTAPRETGSGWKLPRCPTKDEILVAASAIAKATGET